jgi:hypothetical protein
MSHVGHGSRSRFANSVCLPKPSVSDGDFGRDVGEPADADNPTPPRFHASAILVCGLAAGFGAFGLLCSRWLPLHLPLRILRRRCNVSGLLIHRVGRRMLTGVGGHSRCLAVARLGRSGARVLQAGGAACVTGTSQCCAGARTTCERQPTHCLQVPGGYVNLDMFNLKPGLFWRGQLWNRFSEG